VPFDWYGADDARAKREAKPPRPKIVIALVIVVVLIAVIYVARACDSFARDMDERGHPGEPAPAAIA
jgi:hypothetical protein